MTEHPRRVAVVVGNPKAGSRTSRAAADIAARVIAHAGWEVSEVSTVELSELAGALFAWGDPAVDAARSTVLDADLLVVASPVFKASFTGLLKAFADQFGHDELAALPTVPVMIGAGPGHQLAVELQLRPVLIEIGASCPTRGLYVTEEGLERLPAQVDDWFGIWGPVLVGAVEGRARGR